MQREFLSQNPQVLLEKKEKIFMEKRFLGGGWKAFSYEGKEYGRASYLTAAFGHQIKESKSFTILRRDKGTQINKETL